MPVIVDRAAEPVRIRLEGEVDIATAAELKEALVEAVRSHRPTRIALEKATGLDVTALQLLWAAERGNEAEEPLFSLEGSVPETLRAAAGEAGFQTFPFRGEPQPGSGGR
ncbi:MAG: STAS domain-containing protein [Acidobacteriota bacterium]